MSFDSNAFSGTISRMNKDSLFELQDMFDKKLEDSINKSIENNGVEILRRKIELLSKEMKRRNIYVANN